MNMRHGWTQPYVQRRLTLLTALVVVLGAGVAIAAALRTTAAPAESSARPLTGMTILVDPGHGGYDGGARARDSGIWEKHVNLQVAQKVARSLAAQGAQIVMTREDDVDLTTADRPAALTRKRQDMQARVDMAVSSHADLVVSIHMNEYRDRSQSGPQVFYRKGSEASRLLAGCMQEALIRTLQPPKERAAMAGDYFILQLEVPSVLVECGFLSNSREEKLLLDSAYQSRIADAVTAGVMTFAALRE